MRTRRPAGADLQQAWTGFQQRALTLESRPFKASIEVTRNCDLRCVMCAQSWDPRHARYTPDFDMKPELFARVARELFPHLEYAHLQGFGESTLSPHWPAIVETCRPYADSLRFGLTTNLNRRDPAMWRRLVELGFTVIVSCDGATAKTFETIRAGGNFARFRENLDVIGQARREHGRGQLYFYSVLQSLNIQEMPLLVDFAARAGADRITFTSVNGAPYLPSARASASLLGRVKALTSAAAGAVGLKARLLPPRGLSLALDGVPEGELARLREQALERGRAAGLPVLLNDAALAGDVPPGPRLEDLGPDEGARESVRVAAHGRCFKPYSYVSIGYDGAVGACNYWTEGGPKERMGSLAESPFEEIWNGPAYRALRAALNGGEPEHSGCRWCFARRIAE